MRQDDGCYVQPVLPCEVQVALIVGRTAEDGTLAVFHQHEIRDIDRHRPGRVERMHGPEAGVEALFLRRLQRDLAGAHAVAHGDELGQGRIVLRQPRR